MGGFVHGAVFNAGEYFRTDLQALVCGSFSMSLPSLMSNLFCTWRWSRYREFSKILVPLGCLYYFHTKVCSHVTSGKDWFIYLFNIYIYNTSYFQNMFQDAIFSKHV